MPDGFYRSGLPTEELKRQLSLRKFSFGGRWWGRTFDIVHGLCHRLPPLRGRRSVFTLHDVWSLYPNPYQSSGFQKKVGRRMQKELKQADQIVTDSETTRRNLLDLDLAAPEKVAVAILGVEPVGNDRPEDAPSLPIAGDYVLFVGCLEYRKNLGHVVEAVSPLTDISLVVVGRPGYGYEDHVKPHFGKLDPARLHCFSGLDKPAMASLYKGAVVTLLPSWEEGFGLPILEAMMHGSPVVTSNCSACAEVAGEAAMQVPPDDPAASREAIQRLRDDHSLRSAMIQAGRQRAESFTWKRYFEQLVAIYQTVLQR